MTADQEKIALLTALLLESQQLGLAFDIGNAYITRAYITYQTELNGRIAAALNQTA